MAERDAFEAALAALDRKERTAHELALWLKRRDFDLEEIEAALRRLFEAGVLDDERFARRFAEDKRELSGWGAEGVRSRPRVRRGQGGALGLGPGADPRGASGAGRPDRVAGAGRGCRYD